MRRLLLFSLLLISSLYASAQSLSVAQFNELPNDLDARANFAKTDPQTGKKYAIIKVITTQTGFNFDIGSLAIGATETHPQDGEIWVYVPEGTKKIKITHPQLGQLKTEDGYYWFQTPVKAASCYRLYLTSGKVTTTVEQEEVKMGFLILKTNLNDVDVYFKDAQGQDSLVQVISSQKPLQKKLFYGSYPYRLRKTLYHDEVGVAVIDKDRVEQTVTLSPAYGSLQVASSPAGATVTIEGREGSHTTPCTIDKLPSGTYTIRLTKEKYSASMRTVSIADQQRTELNVTMESNFGKLTVQTLPQAEIYIDNEYKGKGSCTVELEPGFYNIETRQASHKAGKQQVEVKPKKSSTLKLEPTPIYGSLDIITSPYDAIVKIDGKEVGKTPLALTNVLIGNHKVKIEKEGCIPVEKTITLEEGKPLALNETLVQGITINIMSNPSAASVYVNDSLVGTTPMDYFFNFRKYKVDVGFGKKLQSKTLEVSSYTNRDLFFDMNPPKKETKPSAPKPSKGKLEPMNFILLNGAYSTPVPSAGITFGRAKRMGWFISGTTGVEYLGYTNNSFSSQSTDIPILSGKTAYQRLSVITGPMLRVSKGFALKAGVGYGMNSLVAKTMKGNWYKVSDASVEGVELSLGGQVNMGRITLSLEGVATDFSLLEVKGGLGINF